MTCVVSVYDGESRRLISKLLLVYGSDLRCCIARPLLRTFYLMRGFCCGHIVHHRCWLRSQAT